jgi:DNA polymerase III delta subunit
MTQAELAKAASLSPFVAGKAQTKSRAIPEEVLKAAFLAAVDTDYRLKTGVGEPEVLVERLIYRVSGSLRPMASK